jgi:hypothetical protein
MCYGSNFLVLGGWFLSFKEEPLILVLKLFKGLYLVWLYLFFQKNGMWVMDLSL